MKQLIITADDYGMSQAVNQAIQEGIENGIITSTNVMMNMPFCDDTDRIRGKGASIGLHWNLTCGKPVLPPEKVPGLVDRDGNFHSVSEFHRLYKSGKIPDAEIEKELTEQYRRYFQIWGSPDYWNSHENVHLSIRVFRVFLKTAIRLNIGKMRSYNRIYVPAKSGKKSSSVLWTLLEPAKRTVFAYWKRKAAKNGILSPDGKICCLDEKDVHDFEYILSHTQWGKHRNAEFTIHPATACDSPFFGNMTDNRLTEYRMVTDAGVHSALEKAQTELISFDGIA